MIINSCIQRSSTEEIYQVLRDRICLLEYPPGTILRESALAEEFDVSRTPIRTALQQLAYGGLIESRDGVGNLVTTLGIEEIRDIYQMRVKMAELIGQMSPHSFKSLHLDAISKLVQRTERLIDVFVIEEYWQINHELHQLIASIIGNSALQEVWNTLYFQAARIWYQDARRDSSGVALTLRSELNEVKTAIEQNDALALGYTQRNYIAYGLARLEKGWL